MKRSFIAGFPSVPDFDYERMNVVRDNHLFLYFCFEFLRLAA